MAKKKSKSKGLDISFIVNLLVIVLGVLALCTLFMPVFRIDNVGEALDFSIKGADVISGAFAGEASKDMTAGAMEIYLLRDAESTGFITNVFAYGYIILLLLACASVVFGVLRLLNMKFKKVNVLIGGLLALLAVIVFIFAIVLSSKYASNHTVLGNVISKAVMHIGVYILITTIIGGLSQVYVSTRK